MSEPYVSVYEPETRPLRDAMEALDLAPVETMVKKVGDDIYQHLLDSVRDWLCTNLSDAIDGAARSLASRYLAEALAGNEEKMRRLLGIWYERKPLAWSLVEGSYPDSWALLHALCERFPDILHTELMSERDAEIAALREHVTRLSRENDELRSRL